MKRCFKCGRCLELDQFYKHPMMSDGHLGKCKDCTKRDAKEHYVTHREEKSAYERRRNQTASRKASIREYQKRRAISHPDKYRALNILHSALNSKKISKGSACAECGSTANLQAHHHDYAKPLDVEWLCFRCHREKRHGQVVVAPGFAGDR